MVAPTGNEHRSPTFIPFVHFKGRSSKRSAGNPFQETRDRIFSAFKTFTSCGNAILAGRDGAWASMNASIVGFLSLQAQHQVGRSLLGDSTVFMKGNDTRDLTNGLTRIWGDVGSKSVLGRS
jgi:hypothetical protein